MLIHEACILYGVVSNLSNFVIFIITKLKLKINFVKIHNNCLNGILNIVLLKHKSIYSIRYI